MKKASPKRARRAQAEPGRAPASRPDRVQRPKSATPPPAWWDRRALALAGVVALAAAAAFGPTVRNGFVAEWDDQKNFLNNLDFRGLSMDSIRWAWTTTLLGVYQPLAWMLLEVQYSLFGLNPAGYHATSLLAHGLVAALVFALTLALLARGLPEVVAAHRPAAQAAAAIAAILWAVHPLRTEVVAWASAQPYLWCAALALGSLLAYLAADAARGRSRWAGRYGLALAMFLAALLCKAPAVTLPAVLVVLDIYPLRRLGPGHWWTPEARRIWLEKLPFGLLALGFMLAAYGAREYSVPSTERFGPAARLANSAYGLIYYPVKTLVPTGLIAYNFRPVPLDPSEPRFVACLAAVVAVSLTLGLLAGRLPGLAAGAVAFAAVVAPNVGPVPTGDLLVADRYSYLSTIDLFVALAAGLALLAARGGRKAVGGLALATLVLCGLLIPRSWAQARAWQDSEALWAHATRAEPDRAEELYYNLGTAHARRNELDAAADRYLQALRRKPDHIMALNNLGLVRLRQERPAEAEEFVRRALQVDPASPETRDSLGQVLAKADRLPEAEAEFRAALRLKPDPIATRRRLADVLARRGQDVEAATLRAEAGSGDAADLHEARGVEHGRAGRRREALAEFSEAVRLKPDSASARNNLGLMLVADGRADEALAQFAEVVRLRPEFPDGHLNLGGVLYQKGRLAEAEAQFAEALRLKPAWAEAEKNLRIVRAKRGRP